ncbi:hypothetical protein ACHHYP_00461 [Achlya hypogyna]|uniref:Ribosomal RNA large subunit methyltransferase K/L-like methyltransferase domain-containing protein n=1 Tax=Achlya hypogyna TaxID=1202772 RepID=A0A1V9ZAQ7_ACHHY|nr:hypothetical protein ACHHYP_00461 [Achlya hypogyna]
MRVQCLALGRHLELATHELRAVAGLYGESDLVILDTPTYAERFFRVDFASEASAKCIVARCVLIQAAYVVLDEASSIRALASHLKTTNPNCFGVPESSIDVKMPKKRIRGPKDKRAVLGPLVALDPIKFSLERGLDTTTQLSLLVRDEGQAMLARLVCPGLSPSTGGHGGRVGSGLAATYALHRRPYTGVTTMDPELALVMANLGQVKAGDWVLDPFAGSAGILLACAHFGMGLGLAHDVSFRSLQGDGPGRDIAANFADFAFAAPERCLADVRCDMWRPGVLVDAIVCDPPYNIRTFGESDAGVLENQLLDPLFALAASRLVPKGRLVCYVCVEGAADLDAYLARALAATGLRVVATVAQAVSGKAEENARWSRSLVVLEQSGSKAPLPLVSPAAATEDPWAAARALEWREARTRTPFDVWRAAWVGDLPALQRHAASGGDLDARDEKGKSPLFFASGYNQAAVVAFLLQHVDANGCDADGTSPLSQAARFGHTSVLQLLLDAGAAPRLASKKRWSPAYYAASHNHIEVLRILHATDPAALWVRGPGEQTLLHRAAECGHLELIQAVVRLEPALAEATDFHRRPFVMAAARYGHLPIVQAFVDTHIDAHDETPLHEAARFGRLDVAAWLATHHAWMRSARNVDGDVPGTLSQHMEGSSSEHVE